MVVVKLKRVYDLPEPDDGERILVDRLWPRGIKKENLLYDLWAKELAPSGELRKWYHQNPEGNWELFREKYLEELHANAVALSPLLQKLRSQNHLTFLYGAKNTEQNHSVVLKEFILSAK